MLSTRIRVFMNSNDFAKSNSRTGLQKRGKLVFISVSRAQIRGKGPYFLFKAYNLRTT